MAHKKLKILYLAKYLKEQTDETHPASVSDLIGYLDSLGIPAERKAILSMSVGRATATIWDSGNLNCRS